MIGIDDFSRNLFQAWPKISFKYWTTRFKSGNLVLRSARNSIQNASGPECTDCLKISKRDVRP